MQTNDTITPKNTVRVLMASLIIPHVILMNFNLLGLILYLVVFTLFTEYLIVLLYRHCDNKKDLTALFIWLSSKKNGLCFLKNTTYRFLHHIIYTVPIACFYIALFSWALNENVDINLNLIFIILTMIISKPLIILIWFFSWISNVYEALYK